MESRKPGTKNYYSVLGVAPESDSTQIKKAYRSLVQKYHPDRVRESDEVTHASEHMIEINEAFAVLSDAKRRAKFDREQSQAKEPVAAAEPPAENWDAVISPFKQQAAAPSKRNADVDKSVAQDFLEKLKIQIIQEAEAAKFKEEGETGWEWSLAGKTWGTSYWVGVRAISLLQPNTARELLNQLQRTIDKKRSSWKNNIFIFIIAFDTLQEGETVLKLLRTFAARDANNTPKNLVNVIALDTNHRRSVLCGIRGSDLAYQAALHAVGVN
jgi:DnaJ-like protein